MSGSSAGAHAAAHAKTAAVNGISIALVFLATAFINIRLPIAANGGLIHLGNVPLFLAAAIFGVLALTALTALPAVRRLRKMNLAADLRGE